MRPALSRGQPPAKGVLHVEQRTPKTRNMRSDGKSYRVLDPRGYWLGQHSATPERKARHTLVARLGRRQFLKQIKERRRATL